jgi:hypothetical protein
MEQLTIFKANASALDKRLPLSGLYRSEMLHR